MRSAHASLRFLIMSPLLTGLIAWYASCNFSSYGGACAALYHPMIPFDTSGINVGSTYQWSGPNGFTSNDEYPEIIKSLHVKGQFIVTVYLIPDILCTASNPATSTGR